jgi:UDP-N-acetylglucosamine diphosphorylase / glucose-1-phosphate thymidylyltransferase / UDP-N-acetylgalactosamine diphosphorylase / glucosamine-1-phosphate N-acetyltransferase / galactosamine-1-phosphate N-acetyltransferase
MRKVVVFDDGLGQLAPLTDLRASFDIRTGVLTTLDRLGLLGDLAALFVPPGIEALCRESHDATVNDERPLKGLTEPILIVNGRCALADGLQALQPGEAIMEGATGHIVAALVPATQALALIRGDYRATVPRLSPDHLLLSRPWHIRTFRDRAINADLARLTSHAHLTQTILTPVPGVILIGAAPVLGGPTARVCPGAILDTELGPIFLGDHAVVRPGAIISGPAAVGAHSTILERATIKPFTSIGPWCKVNGEVGGTIFQGYANKAHDGHLGDSYVGEWSNLGAGTTNSNLLNTYSEIVARATPTSPSSAPLSATTPASPSAPAS